MTRRCKAFGASGYWKGYQCGTNAGANMDGYCGVHFGQLCADPAAFKLAQRKAVRDAPSCLYYVHWNGASWYVKEGAFFRAQGGLTKPWGKAWRPLHAESIEDARKLAAKLYPDGTKLAHKGAQVATYRPLCTTSK